MGELVDLISRKRENARTVGRPSLQKAARLIDPTIILARIMTETAVQAMIKSGLFPMQIAIALAWHLNNQVDLVMPSAEAASKCKALLLLR